MRDNNIIIRNFAFSAILILVIVLVFLIPISTFAQTCNTGDGNGDGKVDGFDYVIWWQKFNQNVSGPANGDFNCSGKVDGFDYVIWWQNFGNVAGTPTPTIGGPTPTIPPGNANFNPFGTVTMTTSDYAFNVNGAGTNIDTISFWNASDPTQSLMFVTSKGANVVEVWKYPFKLSSDQLGAIGSNSCMTTSGTNGVAVDQETDLLYVTTRYGNKVCVFNLLNLSFKQTITTAASSGMSEPNLGLLKLTNGQRRLYVSYDNKVFIHDAVSGSSIGQFNPSKGLETLFGDNYYQEVYIPDEAGKTGVYRYDPNGVAKGSFGGGGIFTTDEEGIWLYSCPSSGVGDNGEGLIVVANQSSPTNFEFFNRKTKAHLGRVVISGVDGTDGIAFTQQASSLYPKGIFAAIDADTSTVGVGWDKILAKTGLSCGN